MSVVTLAAAKAHLSALVEQAAMGEEVRITRRGRTVARITAVARPRKPIELAALRAVTDAMPRQDVPADAWMRQIRDEDRY